MLFIDGKNRVDELGAELGLEVGGEALAAELDGVHVRGVDLRQVVAGGGGEQRRQVGALDVGDQPHLDLDVRVGLLEVGDDLRHLVLLLQVPGPEAHRGRVAAGHPARLRAPCRRRSRAGGARRGGEQRRQRQPGGRAGGALLDHIAAGDASAAGVLVVVWLV